MLVGRLPAGFHVQECAAVNAVVDTASLHLFEPATSAGIYGTEPELP
jgi:hypothetical protein